MKITFELEEHEYQALCGLIDAGVRATGWRSCDAGARLAVIFDAALKQSQQKAAVPGVDETTSPSMP